MLIGHRSTCPSFNWYARARMSVDLPQPGGPVMSSGRRRNMAALISSTSSGSNKWGGGGFKIGSGSGHTSGASPNRLQGGGSGKDRIPSCGSRGTPSSRHRKIGQGEDIDGTSVSVNDSMCPSGQIISQFWGPWSEYTGRDCKGEVRNHARPALIVLVAYSTRGDALRIVREQCQGRTTLLLAALQDRRAP